MRALTFGLLTTLLIAGCGTRITTLDNSSAPTEAPRSEAGLAPMILLAQCKTLPDFPPGSYERQEAGTVRLLFKVDASGRVTASEVVKTSGFAALDTEAMRTLSRCPFQPGYRQGVAVAGETEVSYVWRLR